mgnify:CR=1 FL=1
MLRKGLAVLRMRSVSGLGKARHSEGPPAGALAAGWSAPGGVPSVGEQVIQGGEHRMAMAALVRPCFTCSPAHRTISRSDCSCQSF